MTPVNIVMKPVTIIRTKRSGNAFVIVVFWTFWGFGNGVIFWETLSRVDEIAYVHLGTVTTDRVMHTLVSNYLQANLVGLALSDFFKMLFMGLWIQNYGRWDTLSDWAPLYEPGAPSLARASVWVLNAGLLGVSLLFAPLAYHFDSRRLALRYEPASSTPEKPDPQLSNRRLVEICLFLCHWTLLFVAMIAASFFLAVNSLTRVDTALTC